MNRGWVKVLRTEPGAVREVIQLLARSGIQCHVHDGSEHTRQAIGITRDMATVEVFVRGYDRKKAVGLLRAHMAEGDAKIQVHMRNLPGELAIGLCPFAVVLGFIAASNGYTVGAILAFLFAAVAAPLAWKQLRKTP